MKKAFLPVDNRFGKSMGPVGGYGGWKDRCGARRLLAFGLGFLDFTGWHSFTHLDLGCRTLRFLLGC